MGSALLSVLSFITIIVLGIAASRTGLLGQGADQLISNLVFKLTLPATIIHAFGSTEFQFSLLLLVLVGFLCSAIPYLVTFLITMRTDPRDRVLYLFGSGGLNIGCFALPFVQALFPPSCVVAVCMFDAGNSIVVTGGSYAVTKTLIVGEREDHALRTIAKRLFSSIPFDCYVALVLLALAGIQIPQVVIDFVEPISNANTFLSLFMLGIMVRMELDHRNMSQLIRLIGLRTAFSAILCALIFMFLPFDPLTCAAIATVVWAPMSALTPVYTLWCGGNHGLAGLAGALSIVEGIVAMTVIMLATGVI